MISVEALELLLKVDSAVERHNGGMQGEADYLDAKERLHDFIATLESQLASLQSRLAGYEKGYDPKVKLPKAKFVIGYYGEDYRVMDKSDIEYLLRRNYRTDYARWFPLPGSKGGEE